MAKGDEMKLFKKNSDSFEAKVRAWGKNLNKGQLQHIFSTLTHDYDDDISNSDALKPQRQKIKNILVNHTEKGGTIAARLAEAREILGLTKLIGG